MKIQQKIASKFDLGLFLVVIAMIGIGLIAIYSATRNSPLQSLNFQKQIIAAGISIAVFVFVYYLPSTAFRAAAIPAYLVSIGLLVFVLVMGKVVGGQKSWIPLGMFSFQPAEFAKLATILALAYFLSKPGTNIDSFKDILTALAIGIFPVILILMEPDLGSSVVFVGIILTLLYWKGLSLFGMFVVLSPGVVAIASLFGGFFLFGAIGLVVLLLILFKKDVFLSASIFALNIAAAFFVDYVYGLLSPHQKSRIISFIDPSADPLGSGYNAIQAQIAIGSGGLIGKGYLEGNQTQLQFIPEQWTDFIFCVIGEEFGFLGSLVILGLFLILLMRIMKIATAAREEFMSLIIVGIMAVFFIHFFINVGMAIGILPVIGIPLPFISYGGSSLIVNMAMLGMIFNVMRHRKSI